MHIVNISGREELPFVMNGAHSLWGVCAHIPFTVFPTYWTPLAEWESGSPVHTTGRISGFSVDVSPI